MKQKKQKVFVSGCFDTLHAGHIAFLEEAAIHGEVHVGIGSDWTIQQLKGRRTVFTQNERRYMLKALRHVREVTINSGSGPLDFLPDLAHIKPDLLFVNEDGHSEEKEKLCAELGIRYVVSQRLPANGLPARSTTAIRALNALPYRIDLAGGWLDQPYVSKHQPGPVITISIEPDHPFNDRSGMATSTRKKAMELWGDEFPSGNREMLAKMLFCFENPPGSKYVSGSQDALGIVMPGINHLYYEKGQYWPSKVQANTDPDLLTWIEKHLYLIPVDPRKRGFDILSQTAITPAKARRLAEAAEQLWVEALHRDISAFGTAMTKGFEAQVSMFPAMVNEEILQLIKKYQKRVHGWKLSGAGGGGYLVLVSEEEISGALRIRIRRG